MFNNCVTTTEQGNIGECVAIAYFTQRGWKVSKPLFVNCNYDLVVDDGGVLYRVQVKTTSRRAKNKARNYLVNIKTSGSNARKTDVRPFNAAAVDCLFVLADDNTQWLIPASCVQVNAELTLNDQMSKFVVT